MPQVVGVYCWVEKTKVSDGGDFLGGILSGRVGKNQGINSNLSVKG